MVYAESTYTLGRGDNDPSGIIFGGPSATFRIAREGFRIPNPARKRQFSQGATRDGADLAESHFENREFAIPFAVITGADADTLAANLASLRALLEDAGRYARTGEGSPVVLTCKTRGRSNPRYLDVLGGDFDEGEKLLNELALGITNAHETRLTLITRPFARGDSVAVSATAQRTNNAGAWLDVNGVPGDVPALFQLAIEDQSTSGAINRILANVRHETQGGTPSNAVFARPGVAAGSATSVAETNSLDGANVRRVTPGNSWSDVATVTVTTDLTENSGLLRVLLRVRDRNGLAPPSISYINRFYGGSLPANTTHYYCVTATNASGETVASTVWSASTTSWWRVLQVHWTTVSGATGYRVYRKTGSSGTWGYYAVSGGSISALSDTGSISYTTGDPPSSSSATALNAAAQWRVLHGFANEPEDNWLISDIIPMTIAGNVFELLDAGVNRYPPRDVPTGYVNPGYVVKLQARLSGNVSGDVDFDGAYFQQYHGSTAEAEYTPGDNATLYTWIFDQTADEQLAGALADPSTGALVGGVFTTGSLYVMPGDNRVFVTALQASNVHDVSSTKFTLAGRYIPRYLEIL